MAKHQRLQDAALGVRPAASALAAAAKAAADRTPFRFMLTGVHVTDDAVRSVVGVDKDTWYANEPLADVEDEAAADAEVEGDVKPCSVLLFGRREDGPSVCVRVKDYRPWLHAELPADWSDTAIAKFVAALNGRLRISDEDVAAGGGVAVEVDHYKRYYGWVPDEAKPWKTKRFRYAKLSFPNLAAFGKARSALTRCYLAWAAGRLTFVNLPKDETLLVDLEGKTYGDAQAALKAKALDDAMRERLLGVWLKKKGGLQLPLADTLQKPAARFLNDLGLSPSEWMTVAGFSPTAAPDADTRISNCDVEVVAPATPRNLMPAYDDVTHESPNGVDVYTASRPLEQAGRALSLAGLAERDRAYEAHPLIASATVYAAIQRYAGTGATGCPKKHSAPLAKIAPLVLASFDGEMYAAGDAFPSVVKGDSTKYIGTNFRVGAGPIVRVMQCVGRVAKPAYASAQPGDGGYDANVTLHVECYDSERELFEAWRDLIVSLDPDLLISWNGFGFDFPFMAADYEQCFAGVDERATEGMQQALRAKARELLLARGRPVREETAFLTAPNLLVRFRAVAGWAAASAVVEAARKAHGGKVVKDLLASEKLVAATHAVLYSNNVLTMLGVTADEIEAGAGKEDGKGMTGMKGVDKDKLTAVLLAAGAGALPAVTEEEDEDGEEEKEEEEEEGEEGSDVDEQEDDQGEGESEDEDADPTAPVFAAVDDLEATVAVQLSPLPEMAAAELRDTLRLKLMEAAATACGKRALSRYAREARAMGPSEDITALSVLLAQLEEAGAAPEFYAWVASQRCLGPGVVRLLTMPVPPADAVRRGQYLSRLAAERCPLFEKRMASAAKGDNVYNYYAMTGRTPVDLMQVIKDDKKPEDNSLRYAAEKWLGAAKKPDDKATAATAKEKEKAKTSDGSAGTKRKREDGGGEGGGGRDGKRAKTEAPATATTATTAAAASTVASAPATATATSASAVASTVASASVSATATAASASATATEKGKDKDIGTGDASKAKIDLSAVEMFRRHRQGERDPTRRWLICEYCAKDCEIPLLLVETLKYVTIWVEMSRVCFTPLEQVVNAGQQVKVFNLIARFVHGEFAINVRDSGWPVNDYNDEEEVEGGADTRSRRSDYQGATVIEPKKGFYTLPISTLDFASLYPSIIRFFNLCPSVLVIDDEYKAWDTNPACRHRVTLERHTIAHNVLVGWRKGPGGKREPMYKEEERTYTFATHIQGVLPRLLKHLGACRKAAKAVMEAAEGKAALCKATASFLHGIALSGAKDATEAAQELEALRAGGKPKAGQLRTFQMGLTAGSCDAAGFARARTMLAGAAADLRSKLARESDEDAAKKLTGALAELEAFGAAVDGVEADHTRSVEATDGSGSPKTVAEVLAAAVAGFKANAAIHDMDASVQNGRQLGIKVSMNSVYGFNGVAADKGLLPCKPVAAVTTLKGRAFIEVAKDYAERTYPGCQVVYGDTGMCCCLRCCCGCAVCRLYMPACACATHTLSLPCHHHTMQTPS